MTGNKGVCVIYTGGTLGMVPSAQGYVPATDLDRLLAAKMPELTAEGMPRCELVDYGPPIDSANVLPEFWFALAERVAELVTPHAGEVERLVTVTTALADEIAAARPEIDAEPWLERWRFTVSQRRRLEKLLARLAVVTPGSPAAADLGADTGDARAVLAHLEEAVTSAWMVAERAAK